MIRAVFLIGLFILTTGKNFSQVAKDDFASINKAYAAQTQLSMKMKYEVYRNKSVAIAYSTETGEMKYKSDQKYTRIGKIETVENKKYKLIVDHDDKNISLLGIKMSDEKGKDAIDAAYPVNLENLLSICNKVEFKKVNATQNAYTLVIPGDEYEEVKLIYNAETFFIEKLILYYAEKQNLDEKQDGLKEAPRVEISYLDYNIKPDFKDTPLTYDAFLEKRNGKLVAKSAYKTYRVSDQSF